MPLIYVLITTTAVTASFGEFVDASIIFGVVLVYAVIGLVQEFKAESALESPMKMVTTEATVRRGGSRHRVPSTELVPGDVVMLEAGDRAPANLRLSRMKGLHVDESPLTGNSLPVEKQSNAVVLEAVLGERKIIAYTGTPVTSGRDEGLVCAIGDQTETGRISHLISSAVESSTPLMKKLAQFSRLVLWVILGLVAATFANGVARGKEPVEMFMAAVALAVGVIPEGLPAAVTVVLAIGVSRMAKRDAIIRKLPVVETLGSTTIICLAKTGTLTENQMTVQEIFTGVRAYIVSGNGYTDEGDIRLEGRLPPPVPASRLRNARKPSRCATTRKSARKMARSRCRATPTRRRSLSRRAKAGCSLPICIVSIPDSIPFHSSQGTSSWPPCSAASMPSVSSVNVPPSGARKP